MNLTSQCNSHSASNDPTTSIEDKYAALRRSLQQSESFRRRARHKSGQGDNRHRPRVWPQTREGRSEQPRLSYSPVDLEKTPLVETPAAPSPSPSKQSKSVIVNNSLLDIGCDSSDDPAILEREAKRKEIQSLIQKYATLDELRNESTSDNIVSKYLKRNKANNLDDDHKDDKDEGKDDSDGGVLVKGRPNPIVAVVNEEIGQRDAKQDDALLKNAAIRKPARKALIVSHLGARSILQA